MQLGSVTRPRTRTLLATLTVLLTAALGAAAAPAGAAGLRGDFVVAPDGAYLAVSGYDRTRNANELIVYTPAWGTGTKQNQWGAEAVVDNGVVTTLNPPGVGGNAPIPANGYTLSGHGTAASWLTTHLHVGDHVDLRRDAILATSQTATTAITATDPQPPYEFPGGRGADQLIVYTPAYGQPTTGTNQYGIEAVATKVAEGYRVTGVGGNDTAIPADGIVISGHGTKLSWIQQNVIPGALLTINGSTLSATIDAESYLYAGQLAIDTAQKRIDTAKAAYADAPLDEAAATLATARTQLADARAAHAAGDDRKSIETSDTAAATAVKAGTLTAESRAAESRAVWHRPDESSPAQVEATVAAMQKAGFNQLYLETFWGGQTIYPSAYTDQKPQFAGWDPLAAYVESAKKHDIHLQLWMHSFFIGYANGDSGPGPVVRDHPEWLVVDKAGRTVSTTEPGYYFIDPAIPAARDWLMTVFTEAATKYQVRGVQLDYIRYPSQGSQPGQVTSYNALARQIFAQKYGADPANLNPGDALYSTWLDWQTEQVTAFVRQAREQLPKGTVLSSALETVDNARDIAAFHQDFASWVNQGLLDVVAPEVYTVGVSDVLTNSKLFVDAIGTKAFVSIGIAPSFVGADPETNVWQVAAVRQAGATGQAHFVWHSLEAADQQALARSVYRTPAVDPQYDPTGACATIAKDAQRRITGPYAPAFTDDQRGRLVDQFASLRRELEQGKYQQVANRIDNMHRTIDGVHAPDAVAKRLHGDVDQIVLILNTAKPQGWPAG